MTLSYSISLYKLAGVLLIKAASTALELLSTAQQLRQGQGPLQEKVTGFEDFLAAQSSSCEY